MPIRGRVRIRYDDGALVREIDGTVTAETPYAFRLSNPQTGHTWLFIRRIITIKEL